MSETLHEKIQRLSQEYVQSVENEQSLRDIAFLSDYDVIAGIKVNALTPRLLTLLSLNKSPLVIGGDITAESILTFLWMVKVKETGETTEHFFESVMMELNDVSVYEEIIDYLKRSFSDSVGGTTEQSVPYWSNLASIVDIIAHEYHWEESKILDLPYRRLLQYIRIICKRNDPKKSMFNASDEKKKDIARAIIGEI